MTALLKVLSLFIYEANTKLRGRLIPTVRHDVGILTLNASVLIVVFALRLSAGGVSVMFARSHQWRTTKRGLSLNFSFFYVFLWTHWLLIVCDILSLKKKRRWIWVSALGGEHCHRGC